MKQKVAVLFGGASPEHDVSIITGLQALNALNPVRYEGFPVYISTDGAWFTGDVLRDRGNYMLDEARLRQAVQVAPTVGSRTARLAPVERPGWSWRKPAAIDFDVALLALHGAHGEDGHVQALLDLAGIPYTGMRPMGSAVLMDKAVTKLVLRGLGIPALPYVVVDKTAGGGLAALDARLEEQLKSIARPWCVKPAHLGSSIGVAQVSDLDGLSACLLDIFRLDTHAIVEPFVPNLVEYNVAVRQGSNGPVTSAIERPKRDGALLDFVQKYGSGVGRKSGLKSPGSASEGMLSLTREISPKLPQGAEPKIREWATEICRSVGLAGTPRVDFLSNSETGEIWLNEVNTMPGSFAYYLWEAGSEPVLFTELLTGLLDEALALGRDTLRPEDPVPTTARLFPRR